MNDARDVRRVSVRAVSLLLTAAALSACTEGQELPFLQPKDKAETASPAAQRKANIEERDVEAPEVFAAAEQGLWDGRPSLGGVWVAHPDVTEPERVLIRNPANGKTVIGALFRREREIPGPRLQASSDAAVALGMLAGAPVTLDVVALRREETPIVPETTEAPVGAPEEVVVAEAAPEGIAVAEAAPEDVATQETEADDAAIASAAVAAIRASSVDTDLDPDSVTSDTAETENAAVTVAIAEPRKPWFGAKIANNLFGNKRKKDVGEPLSALNPDPQDPTQAASFAAPAVTSGPIDTQAVPTTAPAAPAQKSSLAKPYIQIGIFSIEDNANRTADQIRSQGMVPTVYAQTSNGKEFWRVVVGPARNASERSALLEQIKDTGFTDAYAVTN
ncbi:MAG: SPOR domain-containing protein [Pseudooceanicola nanhaiensis]